MKKAFLFLAIGFMISGCDKSDDGQDHHSHDNGGYDFSNVVGPPPEKKPVPIDFEVLRDEAFFTNHPEKGVDSVVATIWRGSSNLFVSYPIFFKLRGIHAGTYGLTDKDLGIRLKTSTGIKFHAIRNAYNYFSHDDYNGFHSMSISPDVLTGNETDYFELLIYAYPQTVPRVASDPDRPIVTIKVKYDKSIFED